MESRVFGFFLALILVLSTPKIISFGVADEQLENCKAWGWHDTSLECDTGSIFNNYNKNKRAQSYCKAKCIEKGYKHGICDGKYASLFSWEVCKCTSDC